MIGRLLVGLAAAALLGLAGCSDDSSVSADGSAPFKVGGDPVPTDQVDLPKSYKFSPAVIEVAAGTTVTWKNNDDFPHNVTLLTGPDQSVHDLGINKSASISFPEPGTVYYNCSLHPAQMKGKIIVT